jgi:hypothetical protein
MRLIAPVLAAASLFSASVAHAQEAADVVALKPSSPWAMNYAEDSCHLARAFGEGKDKVTVEFRQFGPSKAFALVLVGESFERFRSRRDTLTTEFLPLGAHQEHPNALSGKLPDGRQLIQTSASFAPDEGDTYYAGGNKRGDWQPDPADAEPIVPDRAAEANVSQLRVNGPFRTPILLELGPMDKPMDAMRTCIDELLTHWGIDAQAHRSLSRRVAPANYPADWLTMNDYPSSMLRAGKGAAVHFRLMVDESGAPAECIVQTAMGDGFDELTCRLLKKRARFTPALDAEGRPIRSFYTNTVNWSLG